MNAAGIWQALKAAVNDFLDDDAMTLAGALAFYTALSFAPLMVILLAIAGALGSNTRHDLVQELKGLVGPGASQAVQVVIENEQSRPDLRSVAGVLGVLALIFSATGVFAQLQASMNRIWDVKPNPNDGVWAWLCKRLLSFGMILVIVFLLLVSLAISTVLGLIFPHNGVLWQIISTVISLGVFIFLFALIFKYLPDVHIEWRNVWLGAVITAILFAIGKFLIGLYLTKTSVASAYGAAGSLLIFLLWVYYSGFIVFFGAELTQVLARTFGPGIHPARQTVREHSDPGTPPRHHPA